MSGNISCFISSCHPLTRIWVDNCAGSLNANCVLKTKGQNKIKQKQVQKQNLKTLKKKIQNKSKQQNEQKFPSANVYKVNLT